MNDSIFTKIIRGDIPSHKIYEDEHVFAFLDINPLAEGHTLVVPKKQVEFVWDLDDETYTYLLAAAKKIALHLRDQSAATYVSQQIVGVDVPHAHIHLIPFSDTAILRQTPEAKDPDHAHLATVAERLRLEA